MSFMDIFSRPQKVLPDSDFAYLTTAIVVYQHDEEFAEPGMPDPVVPVLSGRTSEQDLRGYYPMAARVLADEVRRRKAGHDAMKLREPLAPEVIEAAAAEAFGFEGGLQEVNLGDLLHFARVLEQRHGIGA